MKIWLVEVTDPDDQQFCIVAAKTKNLGRREAVHALMGMAGLGASTSEVQSPAAVTEAFEVFEQDGYAMSAIRLEFVES